MLEEIFLSEFEQKVKQYNLNTVLLVYKENDEFSKLQEELYEKYAKKYKDVINFYKINGEESEKLLDDYDIGMSPTTLFFVDGSFMYRAGNLVVDEKMESYIEIFFFDK